jgi:hypothetical protein
MGAVGHEQERLERGLQRATEHGGFAGPSGEPLAAYGLLDSVEAAMGRIRTAAIDRRDAESYAMTTASRFVPPTGSAPTHVASAFTAAARAASVLGDLLPSGSLPESGNTVSVPRFDTSAAVAAVTSEGGSAPDGSPTGPAVTADVGMIVGKVDISQQVSDLTDPAFLDVALAAELGNAYGERLDVELLNGAGGAQRIRGLLQLTGTTALTVTTPVTPAGVFAQIARLAGDVSVAGGRPIDAVLLHPRRMAWLSETITNPPVSLPGVTFHQVPAVPITLGAETEDAIVGLNLAGALVLLRSEPRFRAMADVLSGTLQIRAEISGYAALAVRQPKLVGKLTGAALIAPAYS